MKFNLLNRPNETDQNEQKKTITLNLGKHKNALLRIKRWDWICPKCEELQTYGVKIADLYFTDDILPMSKDADLLPILNDGK